MRLMHSRAIYNASGHKSVFPLSFANFISGHKALSIISLALLVAVSGWALWLGSQNTGASGNNTRKAASVEVNSTSQPATSSAAQVPASNNSSSTTVNTSTTQSGSGGSTQVNVNGQNIPVPQNGTVEQTIPGNNNQSDVHVKIDSQTAGNGNSSSSSSVQIMSNSSSHTEGGSSEE